VQPTRGYGAGPSFKHGKHYRACMSTAVRPTSARVTAGFAIAAAIVEAACIVATILFFSLESTSTAPHVFGPISDLTTSVFDLLFLPVIVFFIHSAARSRGAVVFGWVTVGATATGAINSAMLVFDLVPDAVSLGITLGVIAIQAVWFVWLGIAARGTGILPRRLGTFALVFGIVMLVALVAVAIPGGWVIAAGPGCWPGLPGPCGSFS
jgi:hypothetical protein